MSQTQNCQHCDGQGFTDIRDCTGEIQRQETCLFCGGTGKIEIPIKTSSGKLVPGLDKSARKSK